MNQQDGRIFLDGKNQIIELLQLLSNDEKQKLLNNIKIKNASMAKELREKSFTFRDLYSADDESIRSIFSSTTAAIIGLSLFSEPKIFQRRVLSLIPRDMAENAFQILGKELSSHKESCLKAQEKITEIALALSQKNKLKF